MNKKSKVVQERNAQIQNEATELRRKNPNESMLSIYATLAEKFDLSIVRVQKIVLNYRL